VILEMQQNREAVQSQLTTEGFHMLNQNYLALLGESPAEVLAKACDDPSSLSTADLIILDSYFENIVLSRVSRLYWMTIRGSFVSEEYWKSDLGQWDEVFSTPAGRAWWRATRLSVPVEVKEFGDEVLANWKPRPCIRPKWKTLILEEAAHALDAG
jgi:hypothetical protein